MKNHEIVRAWPKLKSLKLDLEIVDDQIKRLQAQHAQLHREIRILGEVTDVIDGIAVAVDEGINRYGKEYKINAVDRDLERNAEVYPNAKSSESVGDVGIAKDWGVKLYGPRKPYGGFDEKWLLTGWPYKDAIDVAKRWVTHGEVPSEDQRQLIYARHRLDPTGRATKRRREAFEAAWLADHKQLAEDILLSRVKCNAKVKKDEAHA